MVKKRVQGSGVGVQGRRAHADEFTRNYTLIFLLLIQSLKFKLLEAL